MGFLSKSMAETLVTLTFLSALALAVSVFTKYGKWLALTTSLLSIIAFVSLPSDSIQQTGGMVLVISFTIGIHLELQKDALGRSFQTRVHFHPQFYPHIQRDF